MPASGTPLGVLFVIVIVVVAALVYSALVLYIAITESKFIIPSAVPLIGSTEPLWYAHDAIVVNRVWILLGIAVAAALAIFSLVLIGWSKFFPKAARSKDATPNKPTSQPRIIETDDDRKDREYRERQDPNETWQAAVKRTHMELGVDDDDD